MKEKVCRIRKTGLGKGTELVRQEKNSGEENGGQSTILM
jgi:hypothetical protein